MVLFNQILEKKIFFGNYLKNSKDDFIGSLLKSQNPKEYYYFSMVASLNYFSNVNSMENVLKFVDLVRNSEIREKAETIKSILMKKEVKLENELLQVLMK